MMVTRRSPVTALPSNSPLTTESTGSMGVSPASTRKVAVAESSATPTAIAPTSRDAIGIGAAAAGSIGATCSTVVMERFAVELETLGLKSTDWGPTHALSDAFIQQCCPIATIRGRIILPHAGPAPRRVPESRAAVLIDARAIDLDFEVADFLGQRVAIDAKEIGGADLIAAGRRQRRRQERAF